MDYKKREILIANCLTIRILSKSGRRGSNPRPSAWKANVHRSLRLRGNQLSYWVLSALKENLFYRSFGLV